MIPFASRFVSIREMSIMNDVTIFSSLFIAVGLLIAGVSIPLITERVPPNIFYGFRTRKTLSDERIWYEANRASGRALLVAGVITATASLVVLLFGQGMDPDRAVATLVTILLLSIAGAAWHSLRELGRM